MRFSIALFFLPALLLANTRDGQWTKNVDLKDTTATFPGTKQRPRPKEGWWVTPIHANLLPSGKVLITGWSRKKQTYCEEHMGRQNGTSFVLDIGELEKAKGILKITPIEEGPKKRGDVLYCSGHTVLPNGDVFFIGGARYKYLDDETRQEEYGLNYGRIFSSRSKKFIALSPELYGGPKIDEPWYEQGMTWYPTATKLSDGSVLVTGGLARAPSEVHPVVQNRTLTLFDPQKVSTNPWQVLVPHDSASAAVEIEAYDYPHVFLLPQAVRDDQGNQREVAIIGGKENKFTFLSLNPKLEISEKLVDLSHGVRPFAESATDTTAALTSKNEILIMGGGRNGKAEGQRIDLYQPLTGKWRSLNTGITCVRGASVLLPDGTVLILNGEQTWKESDSVGDRRRPTIYRPEGDSVTNLSPWPDDLAERGYHNIAILLNDGRVLVGGGRTLFKNELGSEEHRVGCERTDMRMFSPPYLFKGDRPRIKKLSNKNISDKPLDLFFGGAKIKDVVLIALGSQTHHFDQNQRYVKLEFKFVNKNTITVYPPKSNFIAPPGFYNLFLISDKGVPSLSQSVVVQ